MTTIRQPGASGVNSLSQTNVAFPRTFAEPPDGRDKWEQYFGPRIKGADPDPYSRLTHVNFQLPEAYRGKSIYMRERIVGLLNRLRDWMFTVILKWGQTDQLTVSWNVWKFNHTLAGRVPHEGVPRLITSEKKAYARSILRRGLAFQMEGDFVNNEMGQRQYRYNIQSIVVNVKETLILDDMSEILMAPEVLKAEHSELGINRVSVWEDINNEVRFFASVGANEEAFVLTVERYKKLLRRQGGSPPYVLIGPPDTHIYWSKIAARKAPDTAFAMTGPDGQLLRNDIPPPDFTLPDGTQFYEFADLLLDEEGPPIQPLSRTSYIGEHHFMNFDTARSLWDGQSHPEGKWRYSSDHRSIYIKDERSNRMQPVHPLNAIKNSDFATWEFHEDNDDDDREDAEGDHLHGHLNSLIRANTYTAEDFEYKRQHRNSNNQVSYIAKAGKRKAHFMLTWDDRADQPMVVSHFGLMDQNVTSTAAWNQIGRTVAAGVSGIDEEFARIFERCVVSLVRDLEDEPYDHAFFAALIEENAANNIDASNNFVGELLSEQGTDLMDAWGYPDIRQWRGTPKGGLKLPARTTAMSCKVPPGFANLAGMHSLAEHEGLNTGWGVLPERAACGIRLLSGLRDRIDAALDSEATHADNRPPWYSTPNGLYTLFETTVAHKDPLFLVAPQMGGAGASAGKATTGGKLVSRSDNLPVLGPNLIISVPGDVSFGDVLDTIEKGDLDGSGAQLYNSTTKAFDAVTAQQLLALTMTPSFQVLTHMRYNLGAMAALYLLSIRDGTPNPDFAWGMTDAYGSENPVDLPEPEGVSGGTATLIAKLVNTPSTSATQLAIGIVDYILEAGVTDKAGLRRARAVIEAVVASGSYLPPPPVQGPAKKGKKATKPRAPKALSIEAFKSLGASKIASIDPADVRFQTPEFSAHSSRPVTDAGGNPVTDADGKPVLEWIPESPKIIDTLNSLHYVEASGSGSTAVLAGWKDGADNNVTRMLEGFGSESTINAISAFYRAANLARIMDPGLPEPLADPVAFSDAVNASAVALGIDKAFLRANANIIDAEITTADRASAGLGRTKRSKGKRTGLFGDDVINRARAWRSCLVNSPALAKSMAIEATPLVRFSNPRTGHTQPLSTRKGVALPDWLLNRPQFTTQVTANHSGRTAEHTPWLGAHLEFLESPAAVGASAGHGNSSRGGAVFGQVHDEDMWASDEDEEDTYDAVAEVMRTSGLYAPSSHHLSTADARKYEYEASFDEPGYKGLGHMSRRDGKRGDTLRPFTERGGFGGSDKAELIGVFSHGNMKYNIAESFLLKNAINRVCTLAVLMGRADHVDYWIKMVHAEVLFPASIKLDRPMIELLMDSLVLMKPGLETGATMYGHANFLLGTDTTTKMIMGNFTFYAKGIIWSPQNIIIMHHAIPRQYLGGSGMEFVHTYDELKTLNGEERPSIIVTMGPIEERIHDRAVAITGSLEGMHDIDTNIETVNNPQYSSADLFRLRMKPLVDRVASTSHRRGTYYASQRTIPPLSFQGTQVEFNPATLEWDRVVYCEGHRQRNGCGNGTRGFWDHSILHLPREVDVSV